MRNQSIGWVATALFAALYLAYSSTFSFDYLVNDEIAHIGQDWEMWRRMRVTFLLLGRGLFGAYETSVYALAGYDSFVVQLVRFLNFLSLAAIGLLLFRYLQRLSGSLFLAFFTVLFFYSQPALQVMMGYSLQLVSNTQPAMWLSLLAFHLHFHVFPQRLNNRWTGHLLVFLVFMVALQSTQNYAYFAVVPLSFALLAAWEDYRARTPSFFLLALLSFVASVLIYKSGLDYLHSIGGSGYKLGEQGLAAAHAQPADILLKALNPFSYWSAFKLWNYPFPFHTTLPLGAARQQFASVLLVLWLTLLVTTFVLEWRRIEVSGRQSLLRKWLAVLTCMAFATLFMIADAPLKTIEHRPHMTLVLVGVIVFTAAYCLQALATAIAEYRSTRLLAPLLGGLVLFNLAGAQQDVARNLVDLRADQLDFIYTELASRPAGAYREILVLPPTWRKCVSEPCGPWMGRVSGMPDHETEQGRYRFALENLGIPADSKSIRFVSKPPPRVAAHQLFIDWRKYVAAHRLRLRHLQAEDRPPAAPRQ